MTVRRLSSNKVDGCWLDYDPRIFVSAIICQVLSTITSGSDIGACTLRWYYALPGWLLTTNQILRLSWSSSYYTRVNLRHLRHIFRNSHSFYRIISASGIISVIKLHHNVMSPHWPPSDWSHVTTQASDWLMLVTWVWCQPTWSVSACWTLFISHKHLFSSHPDTQGDIKIQGI